MSSSVGSEIFQIFLFGALCFFLLRFARRRDYFHALHGAVWKPPLEWFHVLGAFFIYFIFGFLVMPLLMHEMSRYFSKKILENQQIALITWLNFINTASVLAAILLVFRKPFAAIWARPQRESSYITDLKMMVYTLALALPIIFVCSALFDLIIHKIFHSQNLPDQIAVQWLKMTFDHPLYFLLTTVTITVLAPILEETLFRGFLQSFLRKHLGVKQAIVITSFCFSCFHFSWGQGWNNIPIIASLFPLALFLGYLYEKQGSLFASISMHASFNTISLANIYFFGQFL